MTPGYHEAVANWWLRERVYTGPAGFNYLPIFLPFFGLFARLPLVACEILWRCSAMFGLSFGLWRCCGLFTSPNQQRAFAVVTALSLPICVSALRNGQSSAHLAACLVWAAWCLQQKSWGWSSVWLCLALVCKPLGIAAIGLAAMAFPRLWWRLALGVVIVLAGPYLVAPPAYVNALYEAFANNLAQCFDTNGRTFADLNGVLMVFNLRLSGIPSLIVRVVAGAGMAAGCWFTRRLGSDIQRPLFWLGFTGIYIMLFTPMNEVNSYVMLAPALGLWAWWHFEHRVTQTFRAIVTMCLSMIFLSDLLGLVLGKDSGSEFAKFWNALMALGFLGLLLWRMRCAHIESRLTSNESIPLGIHR